MRPDTPTLLVRAQLTKNAVPLDAAVVAIPLTAHLARETVRHAVMPMPLIPPSGLTLYDGSPSAWCRGAEGEKQLERVEEILEWGDTLVRSLG